MVARLDNARIDVNIADIVIRGCETKEDTREIMAIQLRAAVAAALNAYSRTK